MNYLLYGLGAGAGIVILYYVVIFFYCRFKLFQAFRKEKVEMDRLKQIVTTSKNPEEIKKAMVDYSNRFYKIKNYLI
jgi:hypothetical protein